VTTLNNIMNLITPAAQKTAQGNGLSQKNPTLSDFLGMILSPTDAAATQQNLPLSQADMKALTEKIAAMLNGQNVESSQTLPSGLMQLLSASMATEAQDTESQLPHVTTSGITASVGMSDGQGTEASQALPLRQIEMPAALMQGADNLQQLANTDTAEMAQILNDIEHSTTTEASIDMDAEIAALLQQPSASSTQEDTVTTLAAKIAALLQQQNTAAAQEAQAAATPAVTGGQGLAAMQNILQMQDEQPQNTAPQHHTLQNAAQADDNAPLPAPQAQQPVTDNKADGKALLQTAPVTGQNAQNSGMQNGFGQSGFSQSGFGSNGFTFFANADGSVIQTDTGSIQHVSQNFAQYNAQATAQTLPAQTTQMIAVQMQRNAAAKIDSFTLQLDPADLGRLDVELKFHRDGSVQAHLSADRPETLAMLQKDSAHLERILQQAGFDTTEGSLSFDLRQQSDGSNADGTGNKRAGTGGIGNTNNVDNNEAAQNAAAESRLSGYVGLQGVNIMV